MPLAFCRAFLQFRCHAGSARRGVAENGMEWIRIRSVRRPTPGSSTDRETVAYVDGSTKEPPLGLLEVEAEGHPTYNNLDKH